MDLAVHPDGSIYVATRNEIIRLRDTKGNGRADERTPIVILDTKGNYPHNGLCGLSFDIKGNLTFGIGENLGEAYKLSGSDGTTLTGGGEGGNVFHCNADGTKLRRIATGFWNPFGSCRDIDGRLFVVDNDPDSSPPCRLLHVVEGGDYGFQFRYGHAGRHPFQAWNGELPGTLPMVAGTGESPCEVICYESDGLPDEYRGKLLVPAWADHQLDQFTLKPKGTSFTAERKRVIQGGKDFYPSGLAVAPDGSLFVSDWGSASYELHGKGAIWHVRWKDHTPLKRPAEPVDALLSKDRQTREDATRVLLKTQAGQKLLQRACSSRDRRVKATALAALRPDQRSAEAPKGRERILKHLTDPDPFVRHTAVMSLSRSPDVLTTLKPTLLKDARERAGVLLAWRASGRKDFTDHLSHFLHDTDAEVQLLALKWISDEQLTAFQGTLRDLTSARLAPRTHLALVTAQLRLEGKPVHENALAEAYITLLDDSHPETLRVALRAIPAGHPRLPTQTLIRLTKHDVSVAIEALRTLKERGDTTAAPTVRAIALDTKKPATLRAQAILTLAALTTEAEPFVTLAADAEPSVRQEALRTLTGARLTGKQNEFLVKAVAGKDDSAELLKRVLGEPASTKRPDAMEIAAWLKRLDGQADPQAGRRVFESTKLAGCYKCHRVEGRGADIGPDLTLIGRTERKWIVESILQPSAVVAPHFQAWIVETQAGKTRTGQLIGTYLDKSVYVDEKGNRFQVLTSDVAEIRAAKQSIMPSGLLNSLTDQEVKDLVAYLTSRK